MAKSPHTPEWRAMVAQEYLDGKGSSNDIATIYGVDHKSVQRWALRYKEQGISAFHRGVGNTKYTSDFKLMCVEHYISGSMSADEIVAKYNISNLYMFYGNGLSVIMPIENLRTMLLKGRSIWQKQKGRQLLMNVKKSLNIV